MSRVKQRELGGYVEWPSPSLTPDSETWPRRLTESNSASDVE